MAGVTPEGFEIKRIEEIRASMDAKLRARLGNDLDLGGDTILGEAVGVFAEELALIWEEMAAVYSSLDVFTAAGSQLDLIGRFLLVPRLGEERALDTVTFAGPFGTIIPAGTRVRNPSTAAVFETLAEATFTVSGILELPVQGIIAGPLISGADGITEFVTPIADVTIEGSEGATGGRLIESDFDYRVRLIASNQQGKNTDNAIRAALLEVEGVSSVSVRSNRASTPDAFGTPGHTLRVLIDPDLSGVVEREEAIAAVLFDLAPGGIGTYAAPGSPSSSASIIDSQGEAQTYEWEYISVVDVYIEIDLEVLAAESTSDAPEAELLAEAAVVAYVNGLGVGDEVNKLQCLAAITAAVPGASNAISYAAGLAPSPAGTGTVQIPFNQRATTDAGKVLVSVTLI